MWIRVTEKDIQQGKRRKPYACPIALATKRALGYNAAIGYSEIESRSGRILAFLPTIASRFVSNFDNNCGNIKPFAFQIRTPKEVR